MGPGRDHVGGRVPDRHVSDLKVRRLEPVGPFVEHQRIQLCQHVDQRADRIAGKVRVGDMALVPLDRQPDIDRAAATDLHHVTQAVHAGRLTHQDQIGNGTDSPHMIDQWQGAEAGRSFLVTGDDETDRAGFLRNGGHRGDHRRDRTLHVDRAPAIKQFTPHFGGESTGGPAFARRNDIKVAGKAEVAAASRSRPDREKVLDRTVRCFARQKAVHCKAQRCQLAFQAVEHQARRRGDARRGHQRLGQGQHGGQIHGHLLKAPSSRRAKRSPAWLIRWRSAGRLASISSLDQTISFGASPPWQGSRSNALA